MISYYNDQLLFGDGIENYEKIEIKYCKNLLKYKIFMMKMLIKVS